ncbi:MAG: molecular chaperone HtpG [Calditrichales bacterium]|nr:MAG: molecular chaperone HtpG [Calditrichales bacterium]
METKAHTHKFKAEVKQLLEILTHSLYTNREIFLRELISNASDALEKLHFESLKGTDIINKKLPLEISVTLDKDKNRLTISDTGIGMTEKELIQNIGTIAKSGTADFLKKTTAGKDDPSNIIGKFGVGFYSVFMVADEVVINTHSFAPEAAAVEWKSDGVGTFEIKPAAKNTPRGTKIEIYLKEDASEFAEKWKIESIVKKHSNFIPFPIKIENEQINKVRAIWREPKFQVKKEEYEEFYKFLSYDSEAPLDTLHISVDAPVQYNSLIYFPTKSRDWMGGSETDRGLDLYVKRVLIQHEYKEVLPEYLRFVYGVVDSEDIPLNVSRETLQENAVVNNIRNNLVTQILGHLNKMAKDDAEKYAGFWQEFSRQFKLGYSDYPNQEKFSELLRFDSSGEKQGGKLLSLKDYTDRLKPDQKEIYYLFATSREAVLSNPHLEIFRKKGIEVLYLYDPIDEFVMDSLRKYKDHELVSVERADLSKVENFSDIEAETKAESLSDEDSGIFDKMLRRMKDILGERITDVKESRRLTNSPSCLVSPDGNMTSGMQRIMQMMNKDTSIPQKVMEINKNHPLIRNLLVLYKQDVKDGQLTMVTEQLYESALLLEGYLSDTHKMVSRIEKLLETSTESYLKEKK